ncbi:TPA: fimbrial protein [Serratia marcescens]|nr:fimbrial protein [Serratia marcescens]
MKVLNRKRVYVLAVLLTVGAVLWGTEGQGATPVTVKVTIRAPLPCVLNARLPIEVDFGDEVVTTRIDGSAYRQPVKYSLSCSGQGKNAMRLQFRGSGAAFDGAVLQTSVQGLGIAFELAQQKRLSLNSWVNFTYPDLLEIYAVPVKRPGVELPTGEFTAAATLRVDYQ